MQPIPPYLRDPQDDLGPVSREDVRLAIHIGNYELAAKFYEQEMLLRPNDSQLRLEQAKLFLTQCRFGACWDALSCINSSDSSDVWKSALTEDDARFARLLRTVAGVYSQGALRPAVSEMRASRAWLRTQNPTALNGFQVDTVELCLRIAKLADLWSNWLTADDRIAPWDDDSAKPWTGYVEWQRHLQSTGNSWASLRILNLLKSVLSRMETSGMLSGLADLSKTATAPVEHQIFAVAVSIAMVLDATRLGQGRIAQAHLQTVDDNLSLMGLPVIALNRTSFGIDMEWARIQLVEFSDKMIKARKCAALAATANVTHNYGRADFYFSEACEIAMQQGDWDSLTLWREQLEEMQYQRMRNVIELILGRSRQWRYGGSQDTNRLIKWYETVDKSHQSILEVPDTNVNSSGKPFFDIPLVLHSKEEAKKAIYEQNGNGENVQLCARRLAKLQSNIPQEKITKNYDPYLREWVTVVDLKRQRRTVFEVLLNRIKTAHNTDTLPLSIRAIVGAFNLQAGSQLELTPHLLRNICFNHIGKPLWPDRFKVIRAWLNEDLEGVRNGGVDYLLIQLQLDRCSLCENYPEAIQQTQHLLQLLENCNAIIAEDLVITKTLQRTCLSGYMLNIAKSAKDIDEAIAINVENLQTYETVPSLKREFKLIARTYVDLADASQRKRRLFKDPPLDVIESYLMKAEDIYNQMRTDASALDYAVAVRQKNTFTANIPWVNKLRDVAYRVYRREFLVSPDNVYCKFQLWNWVQRSKARALTDMLSLSAKAPEAILQSARRNEKTFPLLRKWEDANTALSNAIKSDDAIATFYARKRRDVVAGQMRSSQTLREICDLEEGRPIQYDDLGSLFESLNRSQIGGSVVLVDWFCISDIIGNVQWYMSTIKRSGQDSNPFEITVQQVQTSTKAIEDYVKDFLTLDESIDSHEATKHLIHRMGTPETFQALQGLRGLVEPLARVSRPEDVLVLCPSGILHRIPLHALVLPSAADQEPQSLLVRNVILYSHSMSTLRLCALHAETPLKLEDKPDHSRNVCFLPFDLSIESRHTADLTQKLVDSLENLGVNGNGIEYANQDIVRSMQVTKNEFLAQAKAANSLLFVGHVHDGGSEPLNSHLCLHETKAQQTAHKASRCASATSSTISAADVLDGVHLASGAHVSLVACASGLASSTGGDDFLGLVPCFLYAGARSTVSTLWPVLAKHALQFELHMLEGLCEEGAGLVHMARRMRKAALNNEELYEEEGMLAWAGFVFHGC